MAIRFARLGWACPPDYIRGIGNTVNMRCSTRMATETPTIVLVRGAWADATGGPASMEHERANATIVEVPASHVSFVSQPEAATNLILQALEMTGRPADGGPGITITTRAPAPQVVVNA